jgi:hypothetical protein
MAIYTEVEMAICGDNYYKMMRAPLPFSELTAAE